MKKLLVVLLAMVLVLGMATSAYAISYTDTDDLSTTQLDAVYRLSALGVLNGYTDGTFLPANSVTRAEFAKIACVLAGLGDVSDTLKGTPSSFSDVAVNMWYTGYVNIAASQGFINGYSDGTFKPNKTISMAEVVTILMRIAGYNDNLAGPWPFDYIAEAGKQDVTDDVTFVSNIPATRADVAVMANNLLDVELVNWDSDKSDFVEEDENSNTDNTVLEDSFEASIYDDAIFDNDPEKDDATDCWTVNDIDNITKTDISDEDDDPIALAFYADVDNDGNNTDSEDHITKNMDPDCYIAGGLSLTDLSGMVADIILNDDGEVIYIKVNSTVVYSDDVSGSLEDDDLEVDDKDYDSDPDFAPWYDDDDFAKSEYGYAKVFINDDGDAYAVADLYATMDDDDDISGSDLVYGSAVYVADSYSDDELETLDDDSVDFDDYDVVCYKDGEFVDPTKIEQKDVVTVIPANGDADYMLYVTDLAEGTLTEGSDTDGDDIGYIELDDDTWYNFGFNDVYGVNDLTAYYNLDGGTDGDYDEFDDCTDINDAFDESVGIAAYRTHFDVAYLITVGGEGTSDDVYGIVTDFDYGRVGNHELTEITILNQTGEEVTYDVDSDVDSLVYYGDDDSHNTVELGYYIEASTDDDGVIDDVSGIWNMYDLASTDTANLDVSGSKIKIGGIWYKFDDDTLFFELDTTGTFASHDYDSDYFDDADLNSVDDIADADDIDVTACIIAAPTSGSTLERVILVNSDMSGGAGLFSFVSKTYTNSTDDYVKFVDGTVGVRKSSGYDYDKNVFYSYEMDGDEVETTLVFDLLAADFDEIDLPEYGTSDMCYPAGDDDLYWVRASDGEYVQTSGLEVGDVMTQLMDIDGDTLQLGVTDNDSRFYEITDSTIFYEINDDGTAETSLADDNDLEEGQYVIAISDDDANLAYVVIFDDYTVLDGFEASVADVTDPGSLTNSNLDGAKVTLTLTNAYFDDNLSKSNFTVSGIDDLSIDSVERISSTEAKVTLDYSGTLTEGDSFTITINKADMTITYNLTTGSIAVTVAP